MMEPENKNYVIYGRGWLLSKLETFFQREYRNTQSSKSTDAASRTGPRMNHKENY